MINLFDLHCDTPTVCFSKKLAFNNDKTAVNEKSLKSFNKAVQICAIFTKDDAENPFENYKKTLEFFKANVSLPINDLTKEHTLMLSCEGLSILQGNPQRVYELFRDGIRTASLTWNGENDLAGGTLTDGGLKEKGRQVIKVLNELNMALDLSHLNDKSFFGAIEIAKHPLATHSNSRFLNENKRNLTDIQLKLIKEKGGLVGINFYPPFLNDENVLNSIYLNIEHMLELGLENNIAIGSDFDGGKMRKELDSQLKIHDLYGFLSNMGINDEILRKIFYQNAMGFYKKLFDNNSSMV